MKIRTAEEIAELAEEKEGIANIRTINKFYREQDQSGLYPINGAFNATERAIRKAREVQKHTGSVYGLEYCYLVETTLGLIVNKI